MGSTIKSEKDFLLFDDIFFIHKRIFFNDFFPSDFDLGLGNRKRMKPFLCMFDSVSSSPSTVSKDCSGIWVKGIESADS